MLYLQEEMRLDSRAADRLERKRIRFAGYEAAEREKMEREDVLSSAARELQWVREREERERASMERCEYQQTHTSVQEESLLFDRYWGVDAYQDMLDEARRRQLDAWSSRAEELRKLCVQIKIIKPYSEELVMARKGKMDLSTGKIIR